MYLYGYGYVYICIRRGICMYVCMYVCMYMPSSNQSSFFITSIRLIRSDSLHLNLAFYCTVSSRPLRSSDICMFNVCYVTPIRAQDVVCKILTVFVGILQNVGILEDFREIRKFLWVLIINNCWSYWNMALKTGIKFSSSIGIRIVMVIVDKLCA